MIWEVPRSWEGQTAVILAGGPSLRDFDARQLATRGGLHIITINDSWRLYPVADVCYFCDQVWWEGQRAMNRRSIAYDGGPGCVDFRSMEQHAFWVAGNQNFTAHPRVHALRLSGQLGFDPNPAFLRHGSNSGYQAIHLAAHFGAGRILLLGYDMQVEPNRTHWHGETRQPTPAEFARTLAQSFAPLFDKPDSHGVSLKSALRGIEVINCTPNSALKCWPMMSLEQALGPESQKEDGAGVSGQTSSPTRNAAD